MMKSVNIKGREYPVRVTMGAMLRYKNITGEDVSAMKGDDMEKLMMFIFCCMSSACHADGVECSMNFDDFVDSLEIDQVNAIVEDMTSDGVKKKVVKM